MIRGVHHVSLTVHDMDLMLAFYSGTLGFTEASSLSWEAGNDMVDGILGLQGSAADVRILRASNAYFELIQYHAPPGREVDPAHPVTDCGVRHVAFDVVDIDAEYERLRAAGISFNCPPTEVTVQGHPLKSAYFRDPEGNVMEIQELLDGAGDPMALPGT
jgi:catechol 2,3-dioxygenase-like lactoylglutathione lyase family enzyme